MAHDQTYILTQAVSQSRISQVALRLIEVTNVVAFRRGAVAQAGKLRKDKPHPVGLLVPRRQFFDDPMVHGSLGLYEADEIRISHSNARALRWKWPSGLRELVRIQNLALMWTFDGRNVCFGNFG